jgi:2-polyprenyl-6-methoxyphenol hydroxylase-like FAD-dependent oxidoreductase
MSQDYDVIVVGARCGGSPTAMLLARRGYRVLLVDRATFPSDTISTHMIHPPGVAALKRWGLLEELEATGCPPITQYSFDFGPFTISGSPRPVDGVRTGFGPRRTVLDALLARAAVAAGAELREAFSVEEILQDDGVVTGIRGHAKGGATVTERAPVVVGADGKHSLLAKAVDAERYQEMPQLQSGYYSYWSDLPVSGFETYVRGEHGRGFAAIPTHDGLTCVVAGWPFAEFEANRKDYEGAYRRTLELVPEFAARLRAATRVSRLKAAGDLAGFFRRPFGPGWALVGDAGYHKDPITAFGITDAFRDAEAVTQALHDAFTGRRTFDDALSAWQRTRDQESLPVYGLTCEFARLQPPPAEMQRLLGAVATSQEAMDDFVSVMAGTLPAPEFFAPDNVARIAGGTHAGAQS